jgi:hypothetical protein
MDWRVYVDNLIPQTSSASYAMGTLKLIMSQEMLLMVYYAYFHSLMYLNSLLCSSISNIIIHSIILFYYLAVSYSRYKFLVDIRYCIMFCIVFFLTVLYDSDFVHNSKWTWFLSK